MKSELESELKISKITCKCFKREQKLLFKCAMNERTCPVYVIWMFT